MRHSSLLLFIWLISLGVSGAPADDAIVVIGHASVAKGDLAAIQRLYTGRAVSVGGTPAIPFSLPGGHPVRVRFLSQVLGQSEEEYTGYWLVRRYVGKGAPPSEVRDVSEMLQTVAATPGAVGFLPAANLPAGANVIFRR